METTPKKKTDQKKVRSALETRGAALAAVVKLGTKLVTKKKQLFHACACAQIGHSHYSMPGKAHCTIPLSMHACMRVCVP